MTLGKLISLIEKISVNITKIESIDISMSEVSKFKSLHYNIMVKILISMLCFVISDMPNLTTKLSQGLWSTCVMIQ